MKKKIFLLGSLVVILDQLVKWLIISNMKVYDSISVIKNFFAITYVQNEGAAWNIFSGDRWFLIIISILAVYAILKYFLLDLKITKVEFVGYSLLLGGIFGNLIDRIVHGYVIDYLDFLLGGYDFPVFNVADACLVVGAILITFHLITNSQKERK